MSNSGFFLNRTTDPDIEKLTVDGGGTVLPSATANVTLAGGNNITTSGAGNTVTFDVTGTTEHAVQVGNATESLDSLALGLDNQFLRGNTGGDPSWSAVDLTTDVAGLLPVGSGGTGVGSITSHTIPVGDGTNAINEIAVGVAGQVLQSAGAGLDPAWSTTTYPATSATGDVIYGSAANTYDNLTFDNTATRYLANTGAGATIPEWSQIDLTNGVTNTLPVDNGGTGVATTTPYAVLCGGTTATGALQSIASVGTADQVLTSNGAGALPTFQDAAVGGTTWKAITADQNIVNYEGYICNKAGLLTLTLPAAAVVGTYFEVTGINTDVGWRIEQGAGQQIHFGNQSTTAGAAGYLESTHKRDSVKLVCVVEDDEWNVISSIGNISVA